MRILATLLFLLPLLIPSPSFAEAKVFNAPDGQVSAMIICEESSFARTYSLFTNGIARMFYDDATKTLDSLKFALLMRGFVSSSPAFYQEWFERKPLTIDKEDEVAFIQSEPAKFTDGKGTVKGQLIIRGIRKDVSFDATLNKFARTSKTRDVFDDGAMTLGYSIHATIKRSDFSLGGGENSPFNDEAILMLDIIAK
ncbi:MAG: YceI family protein [Alphaproteobacteria bacterium]|nr:YceI family protein [Alphaproteobacteria bacterium]